MPRIGRARNDGFREPIRDLGTTEMGSRNCRWLSDFIGQWRRIGGFACRLVECGDRRQYRAVEGNRRLWRAEADETENYVYAIALQNDI